MAFHSFLSRLFKADPDSAEDTPLSPPQPVEQPARPPDPPPGHTLALPQSHALHQLWAIRQGQSGWLPLPALRLEGPGEPPMPDDEASKELQRLQTRLNSTANDRLKLLQPKEKDGEPSPLPDLDAQVAVFLSQDNITAWLLAFPPSGAGRELDREMLVQALEKQQVRFGVDEALLDALPQDPERYFHLFPAARGKRAVPGMDGHIVDLFPRTEAQVLTFDENNRVDYTNLNFIHNVGEGEVICRIIPPTQGVCGRTVQNQEIPTKKGRPATAPKGRNTKLSEDGHALIASIAGHVEFSGRSFQVKPVLDIPGNVDFSVGNINFLGDVIIHGDICSGFTVRAMGNITVAGVVEACTVEAGRDLVVARGVQGDNQAVIRAQRNIFAKYLENSCIYAKMNLETECIINCDVYCDGAVTVRSGHKSIIGGKTHAAHEVSAGLIGSRVGGRTDIILGGQPCGEFDHDLLLKEIGDLEEKITRTERQPDSPSKISRMSRMRMQLMVSRGKLDMLQKEQELQTQEPQASCVCRMICDTVFPGTVLTIAGVVHSFKSQLSPCSASLAGDEICLI